MKISAKTRYGCRIMTALADSKQGESISLRKIAEEEQISLKFLEQIIPPLKQRGFIRSRRGPTGGYRLQRPPADITMLEIIETLDGPLSLIDCTDALTCNLSESCKTRPFWAGFNSKMRDFLEGITLEQLMHNTEETNP